MINGLLGQGCPLNGTKQLVIFAIFLTLQSNGLLFTVSLTLSPFPSEEMSSGNNLFCSGALKGLMYSPQMYSETKETWI